MFRRKCIYLLLASFLTLLVFSFAFAEEETPDPKEVNPEEVDPDGVGAGIGVNVEDPAPQCQLSRLLNEVNVLELMLEESFDQLVRSNRVTDGEGSGLRFEVSRLRNTFHEGFGKNDDQAGCSIS